MEISGVSSKAYTSAAQGVEEDEELEETKEEKAKEYGVSAKEEEEKTSQNFLHQTIQIQMWKRKLKII